MPSVTCSSETVSPRSQPQPGTLTRHLDLVQGVDLKTSEPLYFAYFTHPTVESYAQKTFTDFSVDMCSEFHPMFCMAVYYSVVTFGPNVSNRLDILSRPWASSIFNASHPHNHWRGGESEHRWSPQFHPHSFGRSADTIISAHHILVPTELRLRQWNKSTILQSLKLAALCCCLDEPACRIQNPETVEMEVAVFWKHPCSRKQGPPVMPPPLPPLNHFRGNSLFVSPRFTSGDQRKISPHSLSGKQPENAGVRDSQASLSDITQFPRVPPSWGSELDSYWRTWSGDNEGLMFTEDFYPDGVHNPSKLIESPVSIDILKYHNFYLPLFSFLESPEGSIRWLTSELGTCDITWP